MATTTDPAVRFERVDADRVRVRRTAGGPVREVPTDVALRLWMAGGPANERRRPGTDRFVCFSALRPADGPDPYVFFAHAERYGPEWPAWLGDAGVPDAPWARCPVGAWVRAADLGAAPEAEVAAARGGAEAPAAEEGRIGAGIEERCREILRQSADDDYTESLDYYTTLRVKHAYLRLNATNLEDRLGQVQTRLREILAALRDPAAAAAAAGWECPLPPPGDTVVVVPGVEDDPNHLCTPLPADFDLPPAADAP